MKRMKPAMLPHLSKGLTKREKSLARKGAEKRYTVNPAEVVGRSKRVGSALIRGF